MESGGSTKCEVGVKGEYSRVEVEGSGREVKECGFS
jgi:hypothetical protein